MFVIIVMLLIVKVKAIHIHILFWSDYIDTFVICPVFMVVSVAQPDKMYMKPTISPTMLGYFGGVDPYQLPYAITHGQRPSLFSSCCLFVVILVGFGRT